MREQRRPKNSARLAFCESSKRCWTGELLTPLLSLGLSIFFALAGLLWQLLCLALRSLSCALEKRSVSRVGKHIYM